MSTIRTNKKRNPYVTIDKTPIFDASLTWQARGIMAYLLAKPDDWTIQISDLVKQSPNARGQGREAIQSVLRELQETGYIARVRERNDKGQFYRWNLILFETPLDRKLWEEGNSKTLAGENRSQKSQSIQPDDGFNPTTGSTHCRLNQILVQPDTGSTPPLINNESLINNDSLINTRSGSRTKDLKKSEAIEPEQSVCVKERSAQIKNQDSTTQETEPEAIEVEAKVIDSPRLTLESDNSGWGATDEIVPAAYVEPKRKKRNTGVSGLAKGKFSEWHETYNREKPDGWSVSLDGGDSATEMAIRIFSENHPDDGLRLMRLSLLQLRLTPCWYTSEAFGSKHLHFLLSRTKGGGPALAYTKATEALSNNITYDALEKLAFADVSDTELQRQVRSYQTSSNAAIAALRGDRAEEVKEARMSELERAAAADKAAKGYWQEPA